VLKKRFWALLLVVCLLPAGCAGKVLEDSGETPVPSPTEREATITLTPPGPTEGAPDLPVDNHADTPSIVLDISQIPYYGKSENFRLSAELALAYTEAVRGAKFSVGDDWHFDFNTFYPVFIDVSGDGIPLLLLAQEETETGDHWGVPTYSTLLFGYASGELQIITEFFGIGIWSAEDENLLSVSWETDFGSRFYLYRVNNGGAKLVATENYISDWHGGLISINGAVVSEEEYFAAYAEIPLKRMLEKGHTGCIVASSMFEEYLTQPLPITTNCEALAGH
jgi:hypothetical protein